MNSSVYFALAVLMGFQAIHNSLNKNQGWFAFFSALSAFDVFLALYGRP